jgi:hypothetical protein
VIGLGISESSEEENMHLVVVNLILFAVITELDEEIFYGSGATSVKRGGGIQLNVSLDRK